MLNPKIRKDLLYLAPVIHINGYFYVFGGRGQGNDSFLRTIGRLNQGRYQWSRAGQLQFGRYSHNVVFDGTSILVAGGSGENWFEPFNTELCSITGSGSLTCTANNLKLYQYSWQPTVFLVPSDFCKN